MASTAKYYRLTIRNQADTAAELIVTSAANATNPYIVEPPQLDGQEIDVVRGSTTVGECTVLVADAETTPPNRVVTEQLSDANDLLQLISNKAFIDFSDDGTTWAGSPDSGRLFTGFVVGLRLVDAATWEVRLSDSRRAEVDHRLFRRVPSSFTVGHCCLLGGALVRGGVPLRPDYGGWVYEVTAKTGGDRLTLEFQRGPHPTKGFQFAELNGQLIDEINQAARSMSSEYKGPNLLTAEPRRFLFDGLEAEILNLDGTAFATGTPIDPSVSILTNGPMLVQRSNAFIADGGGRPDIDVIVDSSTYASVSVNDEYRVYVKVIGTVSERFPLHIVGHPVDIQELIWDEIGESYDSTANAAIKATMPAAKVAYRITEPASSAKEWSESTLMGPFGLAAVRKQSSNQLEIIRTDIRDATAPATPITNDDVLDHTPLIWEVDEATVINQVSIRQRHLVPWQKDDAGDRPWDRLVAQEYVRIIDDGSTGTLGERSHTYDLPGQFTYGPPTTAFFAEQLEWYEQALAVRTFHRFSRGGTYTEHQFADSVTESIGEEILLDLDHLPNVNSRGGQRVVQIVGRTELPGGPLLRLLDSGATSQVATTPTFTVAANAQDGRKLVDLTITNAATLTTNGVSVIVEWGFGGATPTEATELMRIQSADIPTTAFTLPAVDAGAVVWVRMRGIEPFRRPSAWTAFANVDLTDLTAPTGLSVSQDADDDALNTLSWTEQESDIPLELYQRPQGDPADEADLVAVVPPGTTQYRYTLVPGSSYTLGVRYAEASPFSGVSSTTETNYTVPGSLPTLADPVKPLAFNDGLQVDDPRKPIIADPGWILGLSLQPTEYPATMVFEIAVETSVGSGTPGSYSEYARQPTPPTGSSRASLVVADDGKLRYFRAKQVRVGANDSGYSTVVSILPADEQPLPEPSPTDYETLTGSRLRSAALEDGQYAMRANTADGLELDSAAVQSDGADARVITKGQFKFTGQNEDTFTFASAHQDTPDFDVVGGILHEPRAKWGATGDGTETGSYDSTLPTYEDKTVVDPSATGGKIRARVRQKGTITQRSEDAAAGNAITATGTGNSENINLANAPSNDDRYVIHFSVDLTITDPLNLSKPPTSGQITVAIRSNDGGGWVERWTRVYSRTVAPAESVGGTTTETWSHEQPELTVAGLGVNDDFEVYVKAQSGDVDSFSVHVFNVATDADPAGGATYNTSSDSFASATPDADDLVTVEVRA